MNEKKKYSVFATDSEGLYMGLDLSTQQLKAVLINQNLQIVHRATVRFDSDLSEFSTSGGVHDDGNGLVTAPVLMWVKALDKLLLQMEMDLIDFSKVVAVSGCAQQHGTVWWLTGSNAVLQNLKSKKRLHTQLQSCFSISQSPVWMDSTTTGFCSKLETVIGGKIAVSTLTGSRAYERFSGNQIAKIYKLNAINYLKTERISLVSSFLCSIFCGKHAPIDYSDGSGMNLLDIKSKSWSGQCLETCAPLLSSKLGIPVASSSCVALIAPFFVERFNFSPKCRVAAFTGDNPASMMGLLLDKGDIAISFGTSDTVFTIINQPVGMADGHIFISPVDPTKYMAMLCFKNGSLARERAVKECAEGSWHTFSELLKSMPRGNFGNIGLFFDKCEIRPKRKGYYFYRSDDTRLQKMCKGLEVRALIEGQIMAMRNQAEELLIDIGGNPEMNGKVRIIATGGGSHNIAIMQVVADIWQLPVYMLANTGDSAALGAAYQAKNSVFKNHTFQAITDGCRNLTPLCFPSVGSREIYEPLQKRYKAIFNRLDLNNDKCNS